MCETENKPFFLRVSKHLKHFSLLPKCKNISHIIIFWKWVKIRFSGDDLSQMGEKKSKNIYIFLGVWNQVKKKQIKTFSGGNTQVLLLK